MSNSTSFSRVAHLNIGHISIKSSSALDARRLADALPALLKARLEKGPTPVSARGPQSRQAEWAFVAEQIATEIEQRAKRANG